VGRTAANKSRAKRGNRKKGYKTLGSFQKLEEGKKSSEGI